MQVLVESNRIVKRIDAEAMLGEAGALFTRGWERKVEMVGEVAKKTKREINTVWIYPPRAERAAALASADPEHVTEV